jgi:hypothetical protein
MRSRASTRPSSSVRRHRLAPFALTVALLGGAACGGDDGSADSSDDDPPATATAAPTTTSSATSTTAVPATTTTVDPSPLRCAVSVTGDVTQESSGTDRYASRELGPEDTVAFLTVFCGNIADPRLRLGFEIMSETASGFAPGPQEFPVIGRPEDELEPGIARAAIGVAGDAFTPTGGRISFERLDDSGYRGSFEVEAEQVPAPGVTTLKHITLTGTFDFPCTDPAAAMCV